MAPPPAPTTVCAGILVADVFVPPLARLPEPGELVATGDFLVQSGGCAANVASALARLGLPARVVGRVGDDVFGDLVERELRGRGIDTANVRRTGGVGTSKTVILPVEGEDRRFVHSFGANAAFTADDLDPGALRGAGALYVGGYLLLPGLRQDALADRLALARGTGARTALDVAVPGSGERVSLDSLARLLPFVDVVLPNEDEARALTGERDPRRQAAALLEAGAAVVVVKQGARGALLRTGGTLLELPAPPVDAVEPSGAGDAFAAGFLAGLLEGWELERCLVFASVLGASACTALGCTAGVLTRAGADAYLAAHPLRARSTALD